MKNEAKITSNPLSALLFIILVCSAGYASDIPIKSTSSAQAVEKFTAAIKKSPRNKDAYYDRGTFYYQNEEYDKAIADFNKVIDLAPRWNYPYHARGACYYHKGDYERTIADCTKAIELAPGDMVCGLCYYTRARAYYSRNDLVRSWQDVHRAEEYHYQVPPEFIDKLKKASGRDK